VACERNPSIRGWLGLLQTGQQRMSFGVALRNGVAIGLGSIATLFSGYGRDTNSGNLETEAGANLVQEDGGFILLE
jgi:hypothetical protein